MLFSRLMSDFESDPNPYQNETDPKHWFGKCGQSVLRSCRVTAKYSSWWSLIMVMSIIIIIIRIIIMVLRFRLLTKSGVHFLNSIQCLDIFHRSGPRAPHTITGFAKLTIMPVLRILICIFWLPDLVSLENYCFF